MSGKETKTSSSQTKPSKDKKDDARATEGALKDGFWRREILPVVAVVLISLAARGMVIDHYHVPTESMFPTIQICDRVLVNKRAYGLRVPLTSVYLKESDAPQRGDVVILKSPEDGKILIKRVTAIGGDDVMVAPDGRMWLNGEPVHHEVHPDFGHIEWLPDDDEPHRAIFEGFDPYPRRTVPSNHYLVMGDNRGNSRDGRKFGLVPRHRIYGRGIGIYRRGCHGWNLAKGWHLFPLIKFSGVS